MRQLQRVWEAQASSIHWNPPGELSPRRSSLMVPPPHAPPCRLRAPATVSQNAAPSSRKLHLTSCPRSHTALQLCTRHGRPSLPGLPRAPTRPDSLPPPPTRGPSGPPPGIRSAPLRGGLRYKGRARPIAPFPMSHFLRCTRPLWSLRRSCFHSSARRAEVPGFCGGTLACCPMGAGLPGAGGAQRWEEAASRSLLLRAVSGLDSGVRGWAGMDGREGQGSAASSREGTACQSPRLGSRHRCVCRGSLPSGCSERMRACRHLLR